MFLFIVLLKLDVSIIYIRMKASRFDQKWRSLCKNGAEEDDFILYCSLYKHGIYSSFVLLSIANYGIPRSKSSPNHLHFSH